MNLAEFRDLLYAQQPRFRDLQCRLVPSSFGNEASPALPRSFDWRWSTCESTLRDRCKKGVMMRLPLSWQIEPALYAVCRSLKVPIFACDPTNIPLAAAALEATAIDAVVTIADNFADELVARSVPLPHTWFIIHPIERNTWGATTVALPESVRHEVHLFPGVPILDSCEKGNLHPNNEYQWEYEARSVFISNDDELLSFDHLKLPVRLEQRGACACGRETLTYV